jgi:hypothetical protein
VRVIHKAYRLRSIAAPTTYLTVIKRMPYRGNSAEEWSNSYAFTGSTPADSTAWRALFDALVTQEKTLYQSYVQVVAGYGYNRIPVKGDHAIWTVDMTVSPNSPVAGTMGTSANLLAGDQAAWIRWGLDRFNTKGKRVYLRKYYHAGTFQAGTTSDVASSGWVAALTAFGLKMRDGTFSGGRLLSDANGTTIVGHAVSPYITTRTLKRRGKRPPT